jgi:glucan-binding YG repeat protein
LNRLSKLFLVFVLLLTVVAPYTQGKSVEAESVNGRINLDFVPNDTVMDPNKPILYMTNLGSETLYAVNVSTGEIKTLSLPYPAERLDLFENKLYVTQHKMSHVNRSETRIGAIAEVNTETFMLNSVLDINEDPYDIAVDSNGYVFVSPGSNQWGNLRVFSMKEKAEITQDKFKTGMYHRSDIRFNHATSKIYSIHKESSPTDIDAYEVVNGVIQNHYDSIYHGDYDMRGISGFSQDGLNLYDNSGNVFKLTSVQSGDMIFNFTFGKGYNDYAFSTEQKLTFGASKTRGIDVYEYGTNKYLYALRQDLRVQELYLQNGLLVTLNKDGNGQYFIESMSSDTPPSSGLPETPGVPDPAGTIENLGFTPNDTVIDPNKPVVYMTRPESNTIYAANYSTGEIKALALPYPAERLELYQNKLYVTQHEMEHENYTGKLLIGAIAEVDTETFKAVKLIEVDTDPYDIAIDNQGYIYITPGSNQWENMKVYSSVTGGEIINSSENANMRAWSYASYNPVFSKVYTITTDSDPRDVTAFEVKDGIIQNTYSSPYHGQYDLYPMAKITPDGKSMYNTRGVVFGLARYSSGDMKYLFDLGRKYNDYEFNIEEQLTYAARYDGGIDVYKYNSNQYLYSIAKDVKAEKLHFQEGLIAVFTDSNGNVQISKVNTDDQYSDPGEPGDPGDPDDPAPTEFLEAVSITYYDDGDEDYDYEDFYDGVENVPINSLFALLFDQEIVVNDPSGIRIVGPDGNIEVEVYEYEDVLYITPPILAGDTEYTLHIDSDAISGYDGNPLAEDLIIQFTTGSNWVYYGGYWYYFNPSIDDYTTGMAKIDGAWYFFNSDGEMQTGWEKINGYWYYFDDEGVRQTGWLKWENKKYYLDANGIMKTGWLKLGTTWYYLDSGGVMKTGWLKYGTKWYYLDSNGAMKTGWLKSGTKWYYLDSGGVMKTGWLKSGTKWYYLESGGAMKTGWLKSGTKWYYLESSGAMKTGWLYSGGKWYYLYSSGAMAYSTTINGYKLGSDGAWIR